MKNTELQRKIKRFSECAVCQLVFGWSIIVLDTLAVLILCGIFKLRPTYFIGILVIIGILLIINGLSNQKLIKNFRRYSAIIANDAEKSLDLLSLQTGVPVAQLTQEISTMISYGFFPGAHIDPKGNLLVLDPEKAELKKQAATEHFVVVQCKSCGANNKVIPGTISECEYCRLPLQAEQPTYTNQEAIFTYTTRKPFYKKTWLWVIVILIFFYSAVADLETITSDIHTLMKRTGNNTSSHTEIAFSNSNIKTGNNQNVTVVNFNDMTKEEIQTWASMNKVICKITEDYSNSVHKGNMIRQNPPENSTISVRDTIEVVFSLGKKTSSEFLKALKRAESYANLYFSKQRIYDQLTSPYGEKFTKEEAQYAIDHLQTDYKENALKKAESYSKLNFSKQKIYDQLTSPYGEKFTKEEAQYAIDHLD